jgi:LPXTG-motif cell wall-anchored protein
MAQGGTTIQASVDKNKILLGEPMKLTVEVNLSPDAVILFPKIDSIKHFEFLEKLVDTTSNGSSTTIKGVYKITSFDSGHWIIPSFVLPGDLKTDTIPVDVVFSDFDPNQDYHDIKDILPAKPKEKKQWWWFAVGGALLIAGLMVYFLRKKKEVVVAKPETVIDPYKEAMSQLEELNKAKPESKLYHTKLVDIFRLYIFRKKGILSLQKTTDDLVLQLIDLSLMKTVFDKLSQSLRLSDFVKFAKYNPTDDDNSSCFQIISESIKLIEQSGIASPSDGGI